MVEIFRRVLLCEARRLGKGFIVSEIHIFTGIRVRRRRSGGMAANTSKVR